MKESRARHAVLHKRPSVTLVPADPSNIIPCRRLVAGIALMDFCIRLAGNLGAHLTEVRRSMTRRAVMALSTVLGAWRRMPKTND